MLVNKLFYCCVLVSLVCVLSTSGCSNRKDDVKYPGDKITRKDNVNQFKKPNILFIVADDMPAWSLGAMESGNAYTPALDKLAKQGALLRNAFSNSAVCSPARAALITGRYPSEAGLVDIISEASKKAMDSTLVTWPQVLGNAGYITALVGKWHLGDTEQFMFPTARGYDKFIGFPHGGMQSKSPNVYEKGKWKKYEGKYTADLLTDFTIKYIREFQAQDAPFALSLHYWAPHVNTRFPQGFELPYNDRSWLPLKNEDLEHWEHTKIALPDPGFPNLDIERVKRMMREKSASVHSVDRNVGKIMKFLDDQKLTNNTIVIFTSDQGSMMGQHGLWQKGNGRWLTKDKKDPTGSYDDNRWNMFDDAVRVPAIVRWPKKIEAGIKVDESIEFIDWFPTLLAMTGIEKPENLVLRGDNMLPLLNGKDIEWNNDIFAQYKGLRMYRTPQWKLVWNFAKMNHNEFYNMKNDSLELHNLFNTPKPDIVTERKKFKQKLKELIWEIEMKPNN